MKPLQILEVVAKIYNRRFVRKEVVNKSIKMHKIEVKYNLDFTKISYMSCQFIGIFLGWPFVNLLKIKNFITRLKSFQLFT